MEESGTEIGNSLGIRFRRPTSAQLSRAVKADEISVVEPHSTTASCSTIKIIERLGLCPSLFDHSRRFLTDSDREPQRLSL